MSIRRIEVPGEPTAKGRPKFGAGRAYTPAKTRDAEERIGYLWLAEHGRHPVSGPVRVLVMVYRPGGKRSPWPVCKPDWDNFGKLTDALNGIAWFDDSQVVDGRVLKLVGAARMVIEVESLEEEA